VEGRLPGGRLGGAAQDDAFHENRLQAGHLSQWVPAQGMHKEVRP
jgi:hypothetical protein